MNNPICLLNSNDRNIKKTLKPISNKEAINIPNLDLSAKADIGKISGMQFHQNICNLDLENYKNNNSFFPNDSIFTYKTLPCHIETKMQTANKDLSKNNPNLIIMNNFYGDRFQSKI
jgi:hypothetical protein